MDLPIWIILASVLLVAVQADPTDQGPQMFSDPQPIAEAPLQEKIQQKRQPKYEEVILYLTPSQIRAYESGKGLMTPQQAAELRASEEGQALRQPQQQIQNGALEAAQEGDQSHTAQFQGLEAGRELAKPMQEGKLSALQFEQRLKQSRHAAQEIQAADLSPINDQMKDQMQNFYNGAGQKMQKVMEKKEYREKEQMQFQEQNQKNKSTKDKYSQQLAPENNPAQTLQLVLQKREKYGELPLPVQFIPQEWAHVQHQYGTPTEGAHFAHEFVSLAAPHLEQQLIPIADPQLSHFPLRHGKTERGSQNYAYLYFYPHEKPAKNEELQHFYPTPQAQKPKEFLAHQEHQPILHFQPKFQLVPYEYAYQNKLEAQQILQAQLKSHHLDARKFETHQLEDFDAHQHLLQKNLEPHFQQHAKLHLQEHKYEPQEVNLKIIPHTAALRAQPSQEIKINLKNFDNFRKHEIMELYEAQKLKAKTEAEEKEAHRLDAQLKAEELKAEQFKTEQLKEELFKSHEFRDELFKSQEFREELFKHQGFENELFKNEEFKNALLKDQEFQEQLFKNHELKGDPLKNQEFNENLFKSQKSKEESYKSEYQDLGYLQKLEPKRTQMYSILNPLFQGHSITESLQQQKSSFPHHKIHLETGFKPLQYAPKFNEQKYAREVEKLLKRNQVEKQKALAKAAAIANEPPEIIHSEEKMVVKPQPMPVIKHVEVPVPTPVMVPIPTPIEVKVPLEIEKHVPVTVMKNVYVKVDKPYYVPKVVPVEVKREIPVEVPINLKKPLKLSIIKHVWEH